VQTWSNNRYGYYIWRKVGSVPDLCCGDLSTLDDLTAYFDIWLTAHGWVKAVGAQTCDGQLPELEFLSPNKYATNYRQRGFSTAQPCLCLAIWAEVYDGESYGNKIVLMTVKPTLCTRFLSLWE
jgi:hypothetical protein